MQYKYTIRDKDNQKNEEPREFEFWLELSDAGELKLKVENKATGMARMIFEVTKDKNLFVFAENAKEIGLPYNMV